MNLKITFKEKKYIRRAKLLYLIPVLIITYPFAVIYYGIKEIGNPGFDDLIEAWKETNEK